MRTALNDHRVWKLGAAVVAALMAIASWFLLISPQLSSADAARADAASTRQANDMRLIQLGALKRQAANIPLYRQQLAEALAALPPDNGLSAFTLQLAAQAAAAHVVIDGITVGPIASATTAGAPAPAASTGGTAPQPTGATTPAQGGIYTVQVSLTTDGSLSDQLAFLRAVQYQGERRALVTGTSFAPGDGSAGKSIDQDTKLTTQLTVFSSPRTPAQLADLKKMLASGPVS